MTSLNAIYTTNGPQAVNPTPMGAAESKFATGPQTSSTPLPAANANETIISIQPVTDENTSIGGHAGAGGFTHDDADVQEYLNRLLKQNSGRPASHESKPATETRAAQPTNAAPQQPAVAWDPSEYVPKAVAPEKSTNLNALREVANQSIRSAIAISQKKQKSARSIRYLVLALVSAAVGGLLLAFSSRVFDSWMIGGVVCLLAAGWPAWKFGWLRLADRQTRRESK